MPQNLLELTIGKYLIKRNLTIATAESCTGGLTASLITDVPGSSKYFLGGVVAYSNQLKRDLLSVPDATLERYGAVSEETALAMGRGVRERLRADIVVSVTGIAGPGGGTPDKPVGLTWIALIVSDFEVARRFIWEGDRKRNKECSAEAALKLIMEYLEQSEQLK